MQCPVCGSEFWHEQRVITLAAQPAQDRRMQSVARDIEYRLVCADCGTKPGAAAKPNRKTPRRR